MRIDEMAFKIALNGIPGNSYDGVMYRGFVATYEASKTLANCPDCDSYATEISEIILDAAGVKYHVD